MTFDYVEIIDSFEDKYKGANLPFIKHNKVEFYEGYIRNLTEYVQNRTHAFGEYPTKLFDSIAPNQSDEEKTYIKETYQPVTKDTYLEFSNTVKRSLVNGTIEWGKEDSESARKLKTYIQEGIPEYHSLEFFMSSLIDEKLTDANSVCAILPSFKVEEEVIIEVNPVPTIFHTDKVLYNDSENYVIESFEKSLVYNGVDQERTGFVFLVFTDTEIVKAIQTGNKTDWNFTYQPWEHEVGYTPVVRLVGMPLLIGDKLSFTSPFHVAVPNLNLASLDNANLLIIKRKVGYPTRVMLTEECNHQENGATCHQGVIRYSDGENQKSMQCPGCKGTGKTGVFGVQSEILISNEPEGTQVRAQDAMAYISPSIDTPKFLREEIDKFISSAEDSLHLKAEARGSGDISATEKNIDTKNTEAFIKPISDQIWMIYKKVVDTIGRMMFSDSYEDIAPSIIKAERFDLLQPEDYMLQIAEARDKGLPEIMINSLVYNWLRSMNFDDTFSSKVFELIEQSDALMSMDNTEIALGLSRGTVEKWEVILHSKAIYLIMELNRKAENFFEKDIKDQITALQDKAKSMVETGIDLPQPLDLTT